VAVVGDPGEADGVWGKRTDGAGEVVLCEGGLWVLK